jgi:hypothetical protein
MGGPRRTSAWPARFATLGRPAGALLTHRKDSASAYRTADRVGVATVMRRGRSANTLSVNALAIAKRTCAARDELPAPPFSGQGARILTRARFGGLAAHPSAATIGGTAGARVAVEARPGDPRHAGALTSRVIVAPIGLGVTAAHREDDQTDP